MQHPHPKIVLRRGTALIGAGLLAAGAMSGCSSAFSGDDGAGGGDKTITLVTHDSWAMKKSVMKAFEKKTGYRVRQVSNGDAGALTNKLVLTKGDPIGDVVYGIDNTFAGRAVDAGILAEHQGPTTADTAPSALGSEQAESELTPVDYGDVCMNVDDTWFAKRGKQPPKSLADLTRPAYKGLLVVPGATTSSPGLAFLLTTIAAEGEDGWQGYWKKLVANDVKVDAGWSDAYETDFTAGGGNGSYPIVLSYASSIPFTIPEGKQKPTTSALLDTCFRQVEYAGVLAGSAHPEVAAELVDFMVSEKFQEALPEQMYVYPIRTDTPLPADWAKYAQVAEKPYTVSPATIEKHRTTWLRQWRDVVTG